MADRLQMEMSESHNQFSSHTAAASGWWTKRRVENGLRRYAADFFAEREMNLPQTFYAYRHSVPAVDQRNNRRMRLYPPFEAVLRHFESLLAAWQSLGFPVFYFPAKTRAAEIAGWRFGRLVAERYSHSAPGSGRIWECQCRCGKIVYAAVKNLFRGRVVSCGCYRRTVLAKKNGLRMLKDIGGRQFGRLTAMSRTDKKYNGRESVWTCVCECGKTIDLPISSLTSRGVKSCGCLRDEAGTNNLQKYREEKSL